MNAPMAAMNLLLGLFPSSNISSSTGAIWCGVFVWGQEGDLDDADCQCAAAITKNRAELAAKKRQRDGVVFAGDAR